MTLVCASYLLDLRVNVGLPVICNVYVKMHLKSKNTKPFTLWQLPIFTHLKNDMLQFQTIYSDAELSRVVSLPETTCFKVDREDHL